ncbi:MAG: TRAP transporter fused permease subunit [Dehalococcoidia bacterium]
MGLFTTGVFYLAELRYVVLSVTMTLVLVFLLAPAKKTSAPRDKLPWYDILCIIGSLAGGLYLFQNIYELVVVWGKITPVGVVLGTITMLIVLEAMRRTVGIALVVLAIFFFLYAMLSDHFPGLLWSRGFSYTAMISEVYLWDVGMFGKVASLWAKIVVVFLLFAAMIHVSGIGRFMMGLSMAIAGHLKGGPAKVAVISSGLFGSISPIGAGNVATTGSVTIPMMKKTGQTPEFAAAVEAVASSGGQIMPPVMGSLAFVIANFLGMPYYVLVISAVIPAILFYGGLFLMVHFQSKKRQLPVVPRSQLPSMRSVMKEGWQYMLPVIVLLIFLVGLHYTPQRSVLYALATLLVVGQFGGDLRLTPDRLLDGVQKAAGLVVQVGPIFIGIGIIVGSILITGIPVRFSAQLVEVAGGSSVLLAVVAALACFIMGAGLPIMATYFMLAILVAPALVTLGAVPLAVHLFILYTALTHQLTPPVMPHVYMAAKIAEANVWKTALVSMRLAVVLFIVPFMFLFDPALLLIGSTLEIAETVGTAIFGLVMLSAGLEGWLLGRANWLQRVLLIVAGVALMFNISTMVHITGIVVLALVLLWQRIAPSRVVRKIGE